ncbi:hypothetical protein ACJJTC_002872 [Scirpophaga incertulas]
MALRSVHEDEDVNNIKEFKAREDPFYLYSDEEFRLKYRFSKDGFLFLDRLFGSAIAVDQGGGGFSSILEILIALRAIIDKYNLFLRFFIALNQNIDKKLPEKVPEGRSPTGPFLIHGPMSRLKDGLQGTVAKRIPVRSGPTGSQFTNKSDGRRNQ